MAEEEQTATAGTPSAGKPSRWHGRRWGSVAALMAILPWFGVAAILILRPG